MDKDREMISEENLEKVVGGLFEWFPSYDQLKFTHDDGSVTRHKILDYEKGWALSTSLHEQNVPEEEILARLIAKKYIEG